MQLPWNLSGVHVLMVQRKSKAAGYAEKFYFSLENKFAECNSKNTRKQ